MLGMRMLKSAEFAPGIPSKRIEPLPSITVPRTLRFNLQRHDAARAGSHYDVRLIDSDTGHAHSWAVKKLPAPGTGTFAPQQPTHSASYAGWSGDIPRGTYGAGKVTSERLEDAEVIHSSPNELRFNLYSGKVPEQYVLRRSGDRMWVFQNATPSRSTQRWGKLLPDYKPQLGHAQFRALDPNRPNEIMQPKVDGAHGLLVAEGGKPVRVFSYRQAKNDTGIIEHTHKFPEWWKNTAPPGLKPTVLRVEITGRDAQGNPVPAATIGGILNSKVEASRKAQQDQGIKLRVLGFGVHREDGKLMENAPYDAQISTIRRLASDIPVLYPMPTARTTEQKARLIADVSSGHHSLTREGVVVIRPGQVLKAPKQETHDVYIRKVLPSVRDGEAGGFDFSWTHDGPIVGVVGSGMDHKEKKDMLAHPDNWVGRVAKVTAKEVFRSGALRSPVYHALHEVKGLGPLG